MTRGEPANYGMFIALIMIDCLVPAESLYIIHSCYLVCVCEGQSCRTPAWTQLNLENVKNLKLVVNWYSVKYAAVPLHRCLTSRLQPATFIKMKNAPNAIRTKKRSLE